MTLIALLTMSAAANAMSYEQACNEALFLTDKMAYELDLTDDQYEAAYEINLDYLMGVTSPDDVYGIYWERRNLDMSYILYSWQWDLFRAASYFFRPLYWNAGRWHFAIYSRYTVRDYFYFGRPHFFTTYRGAHAWHVNGGRSYYYGRRDHFRPALPNNRQHFGMRQRYDRHNTGGYRSHLPLGRNNDRPRMDRNNNRQRFGTNNDRQRMDRSNDRQRFGTNNDHQRMDRSNDRQRFGTNNDRPRVNDNNTRPRLNSDLRSNSSTNITANPTTPNRHFGSNRSSSTTTRPSTTVTTPNRSTVTTPNRSTMTTPNRSTTTTRPTTSPSSPSRHFGGSSSVSPSRSSSTRSSAGSSSNSSSRGGGSHFGGRR